MYQHIIFTMTVNMVTVNKLVNFESFRKTISTMAPSTLRLPHGSQ